MQFFKERDETLDEKEDFSSYFKYFEKFGKIMIAT